MQLQSVASRQADTVVVIPTYCERDNIVSLVSAVLDAVSCEVLVVDDDSPDRTAQEVQRLAETDSRARVLVRRGKKPGLGPSYLEGFQYALDAGYSFIVQMDADFSHPPEVLPAMLEAARHADLVIGSRYVKGGQTHDWIWTRRLVSRTGSWYARTLLGLSIRDVTGGFKCWRADKISSLCRRMPMSTGFAFQIEMNARASRSGLRIVEIPIRFGARTRGSSKMSARILLEGLACVWRMRRSGER